MKLTLFSEVPLGHVFRTWGFGRDCGCLFRKIKGDRYQVTHVCAKHGDLVGPRGRKRTLPFGDSSTFVRYDPFVAMLEEQK